MDYFAVKTKTKSKSKKSPSKTKSKTVSKSKSGTKSKTMTKSKSGSKSKSMSMVKKHKTALKGAAGVAGLASLIALYRNRDTVKKGVASGVGKVKDNNFYRRLFGPTFGPRNGANPVEKAEYNAYMAQRNDDI